MRVVRDFILKMHRDMLFRNSFYLMLGTGVMAGFGFFFWLINARLFTTADIGIATTLISVLNLIALLSLIGFNSSFVRFLPTAKNKNAQINTGLILVTITSTLFAILFIVCVPIISPQLTFIQHNIWIMCIFTLACVMNTLNVITDSIFLAARKTVYTLVINTIFSIFKMLAPFAFIGFGAMGIFTAAALAQTLGTILSLVAMVRWFDYIPSLTVDWAFVLEIWKYNAANYFSSAMNLLPATFLPIIVFNNLGSENAAYYYVVMMIGNLLYAIPSAITRSLFAEGSHDITTLFEHIKRSIRIMGILVLPSIAILFIGGHEILSIFGSKYAHSGTHFLWVIALSGIAVSACSLLGAIFSIYKALASTIYTNVVYAIAIVGLAYLFLPWGLVGIGFAWFIGNVVSAVFGYLLFAFPSTKNMYTMDTQKDHVATQ